MNLLGPVRIGGRIPAQTNSIKRLHGLVPPSRIIEEVQYLHSCKTTVRPICDTIIITTGAGKFRADLCVRVYVRGGVRVCASGFIKATINI